MDEAINKNIANDEAGWAAACIFEDALQVLSNADAGSSETMEDCELLGVEYARLGGCTSELLIPRDKALKH